MKKINKVKEKIKKFANVPYIYEWCVDKCITDRSTEGLQYAVWVANQLRDSIVEELVNDKSVRSGLSPYEELEKSDIVKAIKDGDMKRLDAITPDRYGTFTELLDATTSSDFNADINYVLDWLKNPLREEKVNLSELTLDDAIIKSEEWHNSLKASGKITDESGTVKIEFDDGYYWIDLQTTNSRAEADAMGHCGNTNDGDTLYSLRDKNKSPHVTVAYDSKDGCIYQMKGRNNKKPVEKYHPYIYRFLVDPEIKPKYFGYEYLKEEDFNISDFDKETFEKVFKYNPNIVYDSIEYDSKMCKGLIEKGYLDKEDIKEVLDNTTESTAPVFFDLLDMNIYNDDELSQLFLDSDIDLNAYGELAWLKIYNVGIIDIEKLSQRFKEIVIESGKTYIDADEDDMSYFMGNGIKQILFGDWDWYDWYHYDLNDIDDAWYYLTKETKSEIIEKMIGKSVNIEEGEIEELEITKDMIKWLDDKNDYYIIGEHGEPYKVSDIIVDNKSDETEDIWEAIEGGYSSAQNLANESEYYEKAHNAVKDLLGGDFVRDSVTITKWNGDKTYSEICRFNFHDVIDVSSMVDFLSDEYRYNGNIDYDRENYGNLWAILNEILDEVATINDDYGIYGDIDKSQINEEVANKIYDIK